MKTRLITLLVALGLCGALLLVIKFRPAPVTPILVDIAPGLLADIAGRDMAFHEMPEIGKERYLCVLSGDKIIGFVLSTVEVYAHDWPDFLALTVRGMKAAGAQDIAMGEAVIFRTAKDTEVRRYDIRHKFQGADTKQIYYMMKSDSDYYSVIVTLLDPAAYNAVRARTDKLMKTAYVSSEYKSQKKRTEQDREMMRTEMEQLKKWEAERKLKAEQQNKPNQPATDQRP